METIFSSRKSTAGIDNYLSLGARLRSDPGESGDLIRAPLKLPILRQVKSSGNWFIYRATSHLFHTINRLTQFKIMKLS